MSRYDNGVGRGRKEGESMRTVFRIGGVATAAAIMLAVPAWASKPVDGQLGFQPAATPVMADIHAFHNFVLPIITGITILVLALLAAVMVLYNRRARPKPATFSHNTLIEVVWTALPVVILLVIAIPSFRLLYFQDLTPDGETVRAGEAIPAPALTIKTIGYQWYWGYAYPDDGLDEFASNMAPLEATTPELYRLAVDAPMVAPEDTTVRLLVTAADVIHNWAMPSFGIKMDAIPGRTNETWFHVDEPGVYYGQCSELCGVRHAFMPIEVHVVPQDVYDAWVSAAAADPLGGAGEAALAVLRTYWDATEDAVQVAALAVDERVEE